MKPEIGKYYYVLTTKTDGSISNKCGVSRCDGHLGDDHSLMWCLLEDRMYREPNQLIVAEAPKPKERETTFTSKETNTLFMFGLVTGVVVGFMLGMLVK